MVVRVADEDDAQAIHAIYAPIVAETAISFEVEPPTGAQMRERIVDTLKKYPWLVSIDERGKVDGYAYASRHRERAAYQWAVDTTIYVRDDARGAGVGKRLYRALFDELIALGYYNAFAGITLPNDPSVALHESVGFERIGVYRNVGFKLGAWRDVGWWQKNLRLLRTPSTPKRFSWRSRPARP